MGRMGDVKEITAALVTLRGKRAGRYISGADILVDGGAICLWRERSKLHDGMINIDWNRNATVPSRTHISLN